MPGSTTDSSPPAPCPRSVEVTDRWLDGFEQGELRRHVADCPECAAIAGTARGTRRAMLAAFPAPALADSTFVRNQAERLNAWRRGRWLLASIAVLMIVGLLILMR